MEETEAETPRDVKGELFQADIHEDVSDGDGRMDADEAVNLHPEKMEDDQKPLQKPAEARRNRTQRRDHVIYEKGLPAKCRQPHREACDLKRPFEESRIHILLGLLTIWQGVNFETAVYRTVRMVVCEIGASFSSAPLTRFDISNYL